MKLSKAETIWPIANQTPAKKNYNEVAKKTQYASADIIFLLEFFTANRFSSKRKKRELPNN